MNDFQKFVHRRDPAPYEEIRISPIEKDKKGKEEPYKGLPPSTAKPLVFGSLVSYFKRFLNMFFGKGRSPLLFFDQRQMLEDVAAFKKLLQILSEDDQSHNPEYTQQLSELWHNLLDDCNSILATSEAAPGNLIKLKVFVDEMYHFPPDEDHTLGYYFTEYAGKDWIPFPFMEILQHLHEECGDAPQKATLVKWVETLTDILASAGYKEPTDTIKLPGDPT
ncbi:MAG: hypothetical protein JSR39_08500 [Verrucomicrobia bacterium]|nr:hypothetical protein [Verrucomicrobiota bacterium]